MKTCTKCGLSKPPNAYWFNESKGAYNPRCRTCQAEDRRVWKEANQEKVARKNREWQLAHPERVKAAQERWKAKNPGIAAQKMREWRAANLERHQESNRRNYERWKDAAIKAYGGYSCSCCGETEPTFLAIDHVHNDGAAHRKTVSTGVKFYKWLADNGYPKGFQILCHNCNIGKYRNNGICPHRKS